MGVELKIIDIEHYDVLVEVWEKSELHIKPNGRDSRENIKLEMEKAIADFVIAYSDNKPIGTVLITHDGRKGWINRLAVIPEFRQQGIAHILLEFAEKILHQKGIMIIACLIENWNEVSLEFFKKNGYLTHEVTYLSKREAPDV